VPRSPQPPTPGGLLLRDGDGAFGRIGRQLALGRLDLLEVAVRTAEAAAKKPLDDVRSERVLSQRTETK
jgi:hypothetical protein